MKHAKHPAVACYEEVFKRVTFDGSGEIPNAEEPVGRARFDAELDRRGIEYPENFIDYFQWWIDIGGQKACARLCRQWRKTKENPE